MKRLLVALVAVGAVTYAYGGFGSVLGAKVKCTTIQDGVLEYSTGHYNEGQPLTTGVDAYGYNYQAMKFDGSYANAYLGRDNLPPYEGDDDAYPDDNPGAESKWYWPYRETELSMKWDENWLSNKDCNKDGFLDRHYGQDQYVGSSAWLTNHMRGNENGENWTYFVKIVAAPESAEWVDGVFYNENGIEIGPEIWAEFIVIEEISSATGPAYLSPLGPGFGKY